MRVEREGEEIINTSKPAPVLVVSTQVNQEIGGVQVRSSGDMKLLINLSRNNHVVKSDLFINFLVKNLENYAHNDYLMSIKN